MQAPDQLSWRMPKLDIATDAIAEFGRKFLWWEPIDGQPHSEDRIIAQTMNLGTYDDILLLEQMVGNVRLVEIMMNAEPGGLTTVTGNSGAGGCRLPPAWRSRTRLRGDNFMPPTP
jgi:hypothetical protein